MGLPEAIAAVLAALGLSGAAGLNAWLPLLITGLASRWGGLDLDDPYDEIASNSGLAIVGAAFAVDFVGDKIPAVDHVLHAIGAVVHPLAGAAVAAAQSGADVPPEVLLVSGALVSGSIHAGRASLRPVSTATTAGMGNPVLSLLEDVGSLFLSLMALLLPLIAALAVAGLGWATWRGVQRARRRGARGSA